MSWPELAALVLVAVLAFVLGRYAHRRQFGESDASLKVWDGHRMVLGVRVHRAPSGVHFVAIEDLKKGMGIP